MTVSKAEWIGYSTTNGAEYGKLVYIYMPYQFGKDHDLINSLIVDNRCWRPTVTIGESD